MTRYMSDFSDDDSITHKTHATECLQGTGAILGTTAVNKTVQSTPHAQSILAGKATVSYWPQLTLEQCGLRGANSQAVKSPHNNF